MNRSAAQTGCKLVILPADIGIPDLDTLNMRTTFNSKSSCLDYVQKLPGLLSAKGYISASVDAVKEDSSTVYITLFTGKKYVWESLTVKENDWQILDQLGYNKNAFSNKPFDQQKVTEVYNRLLHYFSNNGYPFAQVSLDSIRIQNDLISARLNIDKGSLYHIDTIIINGDAKISKEYLSRYLEVEEKSVYNQQALDRIIPRLAELPFIVQSQPYNVTMLNTGAEINFYFQNRKSNQVNVLIGFLPSNPQVGGKLLVTGEANLNLRNPFGNGETIGINWQQLQAKSPRLNLLFIRPHIFHTSVGINTSFELYKRDSFFLNIHGRLGAQYNISNRKSVTIALQLYKTNLLNVDTAVVKAAKQLPDMADLTSTTLSFQYDFNNTNYRFNPRRGNELQFAVGFGQKHIKENSSILSIKDPSFDYSSLYDTVKLNTYLFRSSLTAAHYFPIGKQATL